MNLQKFRYEKTSYLSLQNVDGYIFFQDKLAAKICVDCEIFGKVCRNTLIM